MKKTDKKIDNALRQALNDACEELLRWNDGFQWLTHFANYQNFPTSLSVVCVYDTNANLHAADTEAVRSKVGEKLAAINITIQQIQRHVSFDTEENCERDSGGSWKQRFARASKH